MSSLPTPPASPSWDPAAQQFFADWEKAAKDLVAALRSEAGRTRTIAPSATSWASCRRAAGRFGSRGRPTTSATTRPAADGLHHPIVGDLDVEYEVMELAADRDLLVAVFSAEPGSRSAEALDLLAS